MREAYAGILLLDPDGPHPLPGLPGDPLLVRGSPLLSMIGGLLEMVEPHTAFLWPRPDEPSRDEHVRVTHLALAGSAGGLSGLVLLSPAGHHHGLTARELEVLGAIIDGCTNAQIADRLTVASRTVATHIEHILAKLGSPSRTHAAVLAQREGLYVPPLPDPSLR